MISCFLARRNVLPYRWYLAHSANLKALKVAQYTIIQYRPSHLHVHFTIYLRKSSMRHVGFDPITFQADNSPPPQLASPPNSQSKKKHNIVLVYIIILYLAITYVSFNMHPFSRHSGSENDKWLICDCRLAHNGMQDMKKRLSAVRP